MCVAGRSTLSNDWRFAFGAIVAALLSFIGIKFVYHSFQSLDRSEDKSVSQKLLTMDIIVIRLLPSGERIRQKQVAIISALAQGSGIRQIERTTAFTAT